uniref:DUF5949 family protein n=1 Tax=Streptomyces sp. DG1A-41 TaxID=3125779 RepID=UPI004040035B
MSPGTGRPRCVETLAAFTSDEDVLASAAHVVLPARSLRSAPSGHGRAVKMGRRTRVRPRPPARSPAGRTAT